MLPTKVSRPALSSRSRRAEERILVHASSPEPRKSFPRASYKGRRKDQQRPSEAQQPEPRPPASKPTSPSAAAQQLPDDQEALQQRRQSNDTASTSSAQPYGAATSRQRAPGRQAGQARKPASAQAPQDPAEQPRPASRQQQQRGSKPPSKLNDLGTAVPAPPPSATRRSAPSPSASPGRRGPALSNFNLDFDPSQLDPSQADPDLAAAGWQQPADQESPQWGQQAAGRSSRGEGSQRRGSRASRSAPGAGGRWREGPDAGDAGSYANAGYYRGDDDDGEEEEEIDADDPEALLQYISELRSTLQPGDPGTPRMEQLLRELERDVVPQLQAAQAAPPPQGEASEVDLFNSDLALSLAAADEWRHCQEVYDVFRTLMQADTLVAVVARTAEVLEPQRLGRREVAEARTMVAAALADLRALRPLLEPGQAAQVAWALGQLQHRCPDTMALLERCTRRQLAGFTAGQASELLRGMAAASHAPSAPWLDSLLARALQHARQEVKQSAAGSTAPAAAGAGAGDPLQQLMQARAQLRVQERKAAAVDALAGLLAACARLRYLPEERWLAGALPLLLQHLLYLSPGQLASTACSLAALGLLQPDGSATAGSATTSESSRSRSSAPSEPPAASPAATSSSASSPGSSSSGTQARELWDKSLTLLRVLLAAKLGSASSRPAMVVPEGEEEEGAGGEEWDGFEYDVDSGPGQARMLADVLAAAAESHAALPDNFLSVWLVATRPLLMEAQPQQVLSWLCSVAALCDTQPGTAEQLQGLWLADVLSFLHLTRSAFSPGEWARLVPALATVASAGFEGLEAGQAGWDEEVLQQLEGLAAVSGLSLVPGRQRGGQQADGGYTTDQLVALVQGFARLEYSPGPEWLAAHEAAVVAAGVRALQQAGLVAGLAEAYDVLGHRVASVALRAAVASQ